MEFTVAVALKELREYPELHCVQMLALVQIRQLGSMHWATQDKPLWLTEYPFEQLVQDVVEEQLMQLASIAAQLSWHCRAEELY